MRLNDIENWALHIIERVESKQPVEDSRVELKSEWPKDRNKAARQIAGHANAARGEPILWLLGVDEKKGVTGVNYEEISNWKQSVEAEFDGLPPSLTHINIPYKSRTVAALLWETERRPFLVKNPKGGPISLEVPWRDAAATRSAKRIDLLKMLSPLAASPTFELIEGCLEIATEKDNNHSWEHGYCCLRLDVYIVSRDNNRITIPFHKCEAQLSFVESDLVFNLERFQFVPSYINVLPDSGTRPSPTILCAGTEIIIDGAGMAAISVRSHSISPEQTAILHGNAKLIIKMHPIGAESPVLIEANFKQTEPPASARGMSKWVLA